MEPKERTELLEKIAGIKALCNEVLDEFNAHTLSLEQMNARMEMLSKMLIKLSERLENEQFG